jgi:hypothetical protein
VQEGRDGGHGKQDAVQQKVYANLPKWSDPRI